MHALSEACERNKEPILAVLRQAFARARCVLEVGSGTGQHARHFAAHLPHLRWQPSEVPQLLPPLSAYLATPPLPNLAAPLALDVRAEPWPALAADALFSANTLHIMDYAAVQAFFRGAGVLLAGGGVLCVYGPFRYDGAYTSDSNAQFDAFLKARDPASGLRDVSDLRALAARHGLHLDEDHAMPANNRTLVFHADG
jgi:SAM-dependent methyltransferase